MAVLENVLVSMMSAPASRYSRWIEPMTSVLLAGPTCDEVDVLYDKAGYQLPLDLKVGDKVQIIAAGAYTTTYSSVGFNGFPPLASYYI